MASTEASMSSTEESKEETNKRNIEKEELRWPSPPEKRPVLQFPATPPRAESSKAPSTYFDALRGKGAPDDVTKSPSDGAEVRWFYSKKGLIEDQSAALVPSTEAALKGEWLRFGTVDSAALEATYKQQEEKLLSCWWREFAEVSVGPQLRDRERIERGVASTTQGSPQASPQKVHPKSTKASSAVATRLKDESAPSTSKGSPSKVRLAPLDQSAPESITKPAPTTEKPLQENQNDADHSQQSFMSKVSSYLPSFKGGPTASPQSPSKQKAEDKASEKPAGLETGPSSSTQAVVPETFEGAFKREFIKGDGIDDHMRKEGGGTVENDKSLGREETDKEEPVAELPSVVPPSADTAPLTDVSTAAQLDPGEKVQGSNESGEKPTTTSEADDSAEVGIQLKGGLYEGFLEKRTLAPIFWKAANRRILRGSWFAQPRKTRDWLPLREDIAEQLEIAYRGQVWRRRSFLPNGMYAHKVNLAGPSLGLYALFMGEDDTWEAWLGVDGSGVISRMFSSGHPTTRLRRGFKDEALPQGQEEIRQRREEVEDDRKAQVPVKHLVFMVHGIGQRLERANIVDDTHKFQAVSDAMLEQFLSPHQRKSQRVLFIPCQWRKILQLGGENIIDDITMEGIRGIRQIVNATVLDVLYYMSPVYCQDIINSVCRSLNRQYARFRRRNPDFDGQVHIFGHSLGSVLSYDILCHQPKPFLADLLARLQASAEKREAGNKSGAADSAKAPREDLSKAADSSSTEEASKLGSIDEGSLTDGSNESEGKRGEESHGALNDGRKVEATNRTGEKEGDEHSKSYREADALDASAEKAKGGESVSGTSLEEETRAAAKDSDSCSPMDGKEAVPEGAVFETRAQMDEESNADEQRREEASPADMSGSNEGVVLRPASEIEGNERDTPSGNVRESSSSQRASERIDPEVTALRAEIARLKEMLRRFEDENSKQNIRARDATGAEDMDGAAEESLSEGTTQDGDMGNQTNKQEKEGESSEIGQSKEIKVSIRDHRDESGISSIQQSKASTVTRPPLDPSSPETSQTHEDHIESKVSEALQSLKLPGNKPVLISTPSIDISVADLKGGTLNPEVLRKRGPHAFIHYPRLAFEVNTFFAVGSPLGMFLALRNIEFGSATRGENMDLKKLEESMPAAKHMVNIFHPYDPVAYRIEPLVSKDFVSRRPVFIPYHRGGQRLHIGMAQLRDDLSARSKAFQQDIMSSLSSMKTKITSTLTFRGAEQTEEEDNGEGGGAEVNDHTALVMERVTGSKHGRIDFMLQDATFEHPYISALSSHTAYWRDEDTALFVTRHLYRHVPEIAPGTFKEPEEAQAVGGSNREHEKEEPALPISSNLGLRSRQSSTGSLQRSLSVGDQLVKGEDPTARGTFGNILWGADAEGAQKPDSARTHFDSWIADDETGLFYMPGGTSP